MTVVSRWIRMLGRKQVAEETGPRVVLDFEEFCATQPSRRALVSYLVEPVSVPPEQRDRNCFSNLGIAQSIPRVLNEIGFAVDIVNWDDTSWEPTTEYDLFLGHGGVNFERLSKSLKPGATKIYFSTGLYWRAANEQEARRIYELTKRRGFLLSADKAVTKSEEYANQMSDGIICLGNQGATEAYQAFRHVVGINNAAYAATQEVERDFEIGRKHFLFFSGPGNIHKGLDLLLEAFAQLDLHLHICQDIRPEFFEAYRHELTACRNIHLYHSIPMRSIQFYELAATCNWVITATCAEGQPGSIIECMAHGLIPIVPDAANIDLEDWGVRLNACDIVTGAVSASQLSVEECRRRSDRVKQVVRRVYSPEAFRDHFRRAVQQILNRTQARVAALRNEA